MFSCERWSILHILWYNLRTTFIHPTRFRLSYGFGAGKTGTVKLPTPLRYFRGRLVPLCLTTVLSSLAASCIYELKGLLDCFIQALKAFTSGGTSTLSVAFVGHWPHTIVKRAHNRVLHGIIFLSLSLKERLAWETNFSVAMEDCLSGLNSESLSYMIMDHWINALGWTHVETRSTPFLLKARCQHCAFVNNLQ